MRKGYCPITVQCYSVESQGTILTGSKTDTSITLKQVTVEDYAPGFEDAGGKDFATVSFE